MPKIKLDKYTGEIIFAWLNWMEFEKGQPCTDRLGSGSNDFHQNLDELERFANEYSRVNGDLESIDEDNV